MVIRDEERVVVDGQRPVSALDGPEESASGATLVEVCGGDL